jgi:hypothetical protein
MARSRLRLLIALGLVGLGVAILAWLGWQALGGVLQPRVTGIVTGVEARDLGHAAAISVRTTGGAEMRFLVDEGIDPHWTPGHLRDHMLFAEPVTVYYRQAGDALLAYRIED